MVYVGQARPNSAVFRSRSCAVARRTIELAKVVPVACGTVWDALRSRGVTGAGRHVSVYLDDQINLEVRVELASPFVRVLVEVVGSATPSRRRRHDAPIAVALRATRRSP